MEIKKIFREFIDNTGFSGTVRFDEEIAPLTTFKIGGIASVFVAPEETFQIQDIFSLVKKYQIPYLILGGGSNIVFRDGVFEGVVISTAKMKGCFHSDFKDSEKKPDAAESVLVACAAGTSMEELVSYCTDNNLWGLENFSGLPGSVGGAMYMNARCFEKSISELLVGGVFLDIDTIEERDFSSSLAHEELWGYKKFLFQEMKIDKDVMSSLKLKDKSYNPKNGSFEIYYAIQNSGLNQFFELDESEVLDISFHGSNSNVGYYYTVAVRNKTGLEFKERVYE